MEIRKADSKGRVTGFEPGKIYAFDREKGYFSEVVIHPGGFVPPEGAMSGVLHKGETVIPKGWVIN